MLIANSCAAEVVEDEKNGFLCEDTPDSIADRIAYALSHPDILTKCGERARETIPVKWSFIMNDVCDRYIALIEKYKKQQ